MNFRGFKFRVFEILVCSSKSHFFPSVELLYLARSIHQWFYLELSLTVARKDLVVSLYGENSHDLHVICMVQTCVDLSWD